MSSTDDLISTRMSSTEDVISSSRSSNYGEDMTTTTTAITASSCEDILTIMKPPPPSSFSSSSSSSILKNKYGATGDGPTFKHQRCFKPNWFSGSRSLEKRGLRKIKKYSSHKVVIDSNNYSNSVGGGNNINNSYKQQKQTNIHNNIVGGSEPGLQQHKSTTPNYRKFTATFTTTTATATLPIKVEKSKIYPRSTLKPTKFEVPAIASHCSSSNSSNSNIKNSGSGGGGCSSGASYIKSNKSKIPKGFNNQSQKLNNYSSIDNNKKVVKTKDCNCIIDSNIKPKQENLDIHYMCSAHRNFTPRKSLSQMDLQQHLKNTRNNSTELVQIKSYKSKNYFSYDLERSLNITDEWYNLMRQNEKIAQDSRLAGMKIFATIMLNAWRRRRADVKRLNEELIISKKNAIQVKNQIHVLNSLFKIEQKQNDELNLKLRRLLEEHRKIKEHYDELKISYEKLQSTISRSEEINILKNRELEGLEMVLEETRSQLFQKMTQERELETCLSDEQRKVQELEDYQNELMSTITQLRFEHCENQVKSNADILAKEEQVAKLNQQIETIEHELIDLKHKETEIRLYQKIQCTQLDDIEQLNLEIHNLNEQINSYLPNRIQNKWKNTLITQQIFNFIHLFGFYLLPAMPAPQDIKLPKIGVDKFFSYFWGKLN